MKAGKGTLDDRFSTIERPYVWLANRFSRRGFLSLVGRTAIAASGAGALSAILSQEAAAVTCCQCGSYNGGQTPCSSCRGVTS